MPARPSSCAKLAEITPRRARRPARGRGPSAGRRRACRRRRWPAAWRRSCAGQLVTSASSCSAGTTRFTRPHSSACCALIGSPVSSISMACLRCRLRPTATPGVEQKKPQVTPLVTNFAAVDGDGEVALRDELAAGRGGGALHARDHRLRQRGMVCIMRLHCANSASIFGSSLQRLDLLQVVPGAEALAGGGEDQRRGSCRCSSKWLRKHPEARPASRPSAGSSAAGGSASACRCRRGLRAAGAAGRSVGRRSCHQVSMAAADLAFSRSTNFWILPVEVFGSSPNTTARGALKLRHAARGRTR